MGHRGFTRASTLAHIVDVIAESGGSPERVFQRADLPLMIQHSPDALVPLRDHFGLLLLSGRELKDELFGARLGQMVTMDNLGTYGRWVAMAPTLLDGLRRANSSLAYMLQSATALVLRVKGRRAIWTYESLDSAIEGRQQNEILALFHMVAICRSFLGADWRPDLAVVSGQPVSASGELEQLFGTDVLFHEGTGGLVFDRQLLAARRPKSVCDGLSMSELDRALSVPAPGDFEGSVAALIDLELLEKLPTLDWAAAKLGLSPRSLQRQLGQRGTRFSELVQAALEKRAFDLLINSDLSITEIATSLGYSDSAHFTRAFKRWTGQAPQVWREDSA